MATTNVRMDSSSLSVVWNRTFEMSATGREVTKERWLRVKLDAADGSIAQKFTLLAQSHLQFRIGTSERANDAKGTNTFYPKGIECAQLFCILGGVNVATVDMAGFDAAKWMNRLPEGSLAVSRLKNYIARLADEAEQKAKQEAIDKAAKEDEARRAAAPSDRISDGATIPGTPAKNAKKGSKATA